MVSLDLISKKKSRLQFGKFGHRKKMVLVLENLVSGSLGFGQNFGIVISFKGLSISGRIP